MRARFALTLAVLALLCVATPWAKAEEVSVIFPQESTTTVYTLRPGVYQVMIPKPMTLVPSQLAAYEGWTNLTFIYSLWRFGTDEKPFSLERGLPTYLGQEYGDYLESQGIPPFPADLYWTVLLGEPDKAMADDKELRTTLDYYFAQFKQFLSQRLADPADDLWMQLPKPIPNKWLATGSVHVIQQSGYQLTFSIAEGEGCLTAYEGAGTWDGLNVQAISGYSATDAGDPAVPAANGFYQLVTSSGSTIRLSQNQTVVQTKALAPASSVRAFGFYRSPAPPIIWIPGQRKPLPGNRLPPDGNDGKKPNRFSDPTGWSAMVASYGSWLQSEDSKTKPVYDKVFHVFITAKISADLKAGVYGAATEVAAGTTIEVPTFSILLERYRFVDYYRKEVVPGSAEYHGGELLPPWICKYQYVWVKRTKQMQYGTTYSPMSGAVFNNLFLHIYGRPDPYLNNYVIENLASKGVY